MQVSSSRFFSRALPGRATGRPQGRGPGPPQGAGGGEATHRRHAASVGQGGLGQALSVGKKQSTRSAGPDGADGRPAPPHGSISRRAARPAEACGRPPRPGTTSIPLPGAGHGNPRLRTGPSPPPPRRHISVAAPAPLPQLLSRPSAAPL